jgi:broad specificity phosphatase PhoE
MSKHQIARALLDALSDLDGVCSVTLVGSVVDRDDLTGISDLDTVVVFDHLSVDRINMAIGRVERLTGADLGAPAKTVLVNATFGPLKLDTDDCLVVHLMLYDVASHRAHVLKSPFTCFDWERSDVRVGLPLREIYPVGALALGDFISARRGLTDYIDDLEAGRITYRRLSAEGGRVIERVEHQRLDPRHQGEYAYHIIHNLVANALKMLAGVNRLWPVDELRERWRDGLPALAGWLPLYDQLRAIKQRRGSDFPAETIPSTRAFLAAFGAWLDSVSRGAFHLRLYRHGITSLNDRTFLGRGRDPGILAPAAALEADLTEIQSSPLRRATETAASLAPQARLRVDERLIEIDYGHAEGMTADELRTRFPEIADAWSRTEDVAFPGGEGHQEVLARVRAYLGAQPAGPGRAVAVTHNVVLRVLVAELCGLDVRRAYVIPIAHLEPIDICRVGTRWMPNWDRQRQAALIDGYTGYSEHQT